MIVQGTLKVSRVLTSQIARYERLFLRLGTRRGQLELLLLYQPPCYLVISLPEHFDSMAGLAVKVPELLGDFNLPYLGAGLEVAQKFVVTMTAKGLVQIMQSPTHSSDNTLDLVFLLEQWQHVLDLGEILISPLLWTDHSLMSLKFSCPTPPLRETRPIKLALPRQLMVLTGFQREHTNYFRKPITWSD